MENSILEQHNSTENDKYEIEDISLYPEDVMTSADLQLWPIGYDIAPFIYIKTNFLVYPKLPVKTIDQMSYPGSVVVCVDPWLSYKSNLL